MSIGMASPNEQPQLVAFNKKDTNKMSKTVKLIYKSPAERYGNQFDIALIVITCLAFATRFWKLSHPDEIVFDEVHVGKFASYYLRQQYFFDVHPPFGKLLFAFIGWLVGFDGSFMFEKIGISYSKDKIPYVAYRSLPAFLSSCTLPIIFLTMKEAGYSLPASILSASIVLFDNAHICFSRLILLDAMLIFAIMCTIYSYIMFYKQRHSPFSYSWWKWLFLIGVALSSTISIKYIGVFTFMTIGVAVIINLWDLLGIERGQSIFIFIQHIIYRLFCLIIIPFVIYLFWFYIHFEILKNSGPGDAFMTTEFRDTLQNSSLVKQGLAVHYYDKITLKHIDTNAFLHSHPQRYPVRYENGRVSSNGQQVTAVPFEDKNNIWIVLPEKDENEQRLGYPVKYNDTVRFLHVSTQTILLAHNVASPLYITNPEFTTVPLDQATERHPYTLFQLRPTHNKAEDIVYTKLGILNVIHTFANVAMWTHNDVYLPKWGFGQQEDGGLNVWF
ncbi:unnamed protein product [Adineta steineri]|uniref:dolichyl-phosphate-mannose--protein mannosyltransferase n=1 Tax=Adineta steineri TaxID=433720 RepID=A0A819AA79_9BILA|nr:unnamed protein product [Adineta steineri]CAF1369317.1 unnamed protein product [Adineta steineri]CAF3781741.1 unnamed protein product [Adineta steineri]CAF3837208.1 unnamed protein product [Adineta steineri]